MEKKNILYIFNDNRFGGAGQSLLDTLSEIKKCVNPTVIIRNNADVRTKFEEMGIRYYKIHFTENFVKVGMVDEGKKQEDLAQSLEAAEALIPILRKERIQLIHINSSVSYFAAIAALREGIPYVWHIRELLEEQFHCEFINERLILSLFQKADRLITISNYVKKAYSDKYGLNTERLYNGLNINRFKQQIEKKQEFRRTFIAAGMIMPEKGQWDIIRAAKILKDRGCDDIHVAIVGDVTRKYAWALKKYIRNEKLDQNIQILSYCDDLAELRKEASYAITSSQNEALGRVTIESMLAGNFVIGARSGGTTEIIGEHEERGFLYELHNSESLADAMQRAMLCPVDTKSRILKAAQRYAEQTFDANQYCRTLDKLYDEIISAHKQTDQSALLDAVRNAYKKGGSRVMRMDSKYAADKYRKSEAALALAVSWIKIKQENRGLVDYFKKKKIRSIAIYGMAVLGRRLYDELENEDIEIKYLIDREPTGMEQVLPFKELGENIEDVEAVVVTVAATEKEVVESVRRYGYRMVIGLSEIIYSFDDSFEGMAVR